MAHEMTFPGRMRTHSGRLTAYALACGYVELVGGVFLKMTSPASGVYDVIYTRRDGSRSWETYRSLIMARRAWRDAINEMGEDAR